MVKADEIPELCDSSDDERLYQKPNTMYAKQDNAMMLNLYTSIQVDQFKYQFNLLCSTFFKNLTFDILTIKRYDNL